MKRIFVLLLTLGLSVTAKSAMNISVVDLFLDPGESTYVSIWGDGYDNPSTFFMGIIKNSPGSLNINQAHILYPGSSIGIYWENEKEIADILNVYNPYVVIELQDVPPPGDEPPPLFGQLADGIIFSKNAWGNSTIGLFDGDGTLLDSKMIYDTPEPMTLALFGLGGIILRRRK